MGAAQEGAGAAELVGVARGTVQARLDRLQERGVVKSFAPTVDPGALGYPVTMSQVMPKTDVNSQIAAYFGDFAMGAKFGEVTGSMAIAMDTSLGFKSHTTYFRCSERIAINVHDVGDTTDAGPIVGLISAAS
mgnify:CR=1 FL=1